jgi:two-component system OmpR family response regulator
MSDNTILLVEDDEQIAQAIVFRLRAEGYRPLHALTTKQANEIIASTPPALIILDIGLPEQDGFAWLSRRPASSQTIPVIILTARGTTEDKVRGLMLGADDYLTKPFAFAELLARIAAVSRRRPAPQRNVIPIGNLLINLDQKRVFVDERGLDLSPREYAVLVAMAEQPGRVINKSQIVQHLAHEDTRAADLNESTVEVIVHRLRRKLEQANVQIETARGFGYMLK